MGARVVTREKKVISDLMRGHGSVPLCPIPRSEAFGFDGEAMGVVATMSVRGGSFAELPSAAAVEAEQWGDIAGQESSYRRF